MPRLTRAELWRDTESGPLVPAGRYEYEYTMGVLPTGKRSSYKGRLYSGRSPLYRSAMEKKGVIYLTFWASNDHDAYAHLLAAYAPDDARPLDGYKSLRIGRDNRTVRLVTPEELRQTARVYAQTVHVL